MNMLSNETIWFVRFKKIANKKIEEGGGIKFVHGFANISPLQSVEE